MAFTNETKNYGLPDWIGPDKPTWLVDLNNAFETIDNQMKSNETAAMQAKQIGESAMDTAGNAVEATHTNASAISALTSSLAETDTRVDALEGPKIKRYITRATLPGLGVETMYAYWVNSAVTIFEVAVGTSISKSSFSVVPNSSGLTATDYTLGKLPLYGNSLDNTFTTNTVVFRGYFINTANATHVDLDIKRGSDGYYYTISKNVYNSMGDDMYIGWIGGVLTTTDATWPTT